MRLAIRQWRVVAPEAGGASDANDVVMAGLVPAIHVLVYESQTWITGTSPVMTMF